MGHAWMIGIGQTLGNYQIVSKLGSGGMGAVYLAEHPLIGKKVALKVIHRELAMNREVVTRFFNEARAVNQIGNDHIVDISDFGQTPEGEYFFVMEHLNGKSLGDVLQEQRILAVPRAVHISAQLAEALVASHGCGIIHRDLKPDNIFLVHKLGAPDFVKVLDFGLAKLVGDGTATGLTKQGVILGTPQYMSPEQCESKGNVDHRTDVYSLGILMYQMLTGYLPFDGQSMGEVLVKQVTQPVTPPRSLNDQIPPSVEQIILRCLAKRADARFQNMADVLAALREPDRFMAGGGGVSAARTQMQGAAVGAMPEPRASQRPPAQVGRASGPAPALAGPAVGGAAAGNAATMMLDGGSHAVGGGAAMAVAAAPIAEQRTMFLPGGSHAAPAGGAPAPGGPPGPGGMPPAAGGAPIAEQRTMFLPGGSHAAPAGGAPGPGSPPVPGAAAAPGAPIAEQRTMFLPGGSHAAPAADGVSAGAAGPPAMGGAPGAPGIAMGGIPSPGGFGGGNPAPGAFGADGGFGQDPFAAPGAFGSNGAFGANGAFGGFEAPRMAIPRQRSSGKRWVLGIGFVVIAAGITVGVLFAVKSKEKPGKKAQIAASSAATASTKPAATASTKPIDGETPTPRPETQPTVTPTATPPATQPAATPGTTPAAGGAAPVVQDLATVKITITSEPTGAEIFDEASGERLGRTPTDITVPRDTERALLFRHADCGEKRKVVRASNDTEIAVALQRLEKTSPEEDGKPKSDRPRRKKRKPSSDDEIMTPSL